MSALRVMLAGAERKIHSHPVAEERDAESSVGMRDPGAARGLQGRPFQGLRKHPRPPQRGYSLRPRPPRSPSASLEAPGPPEVLPRTPLLCIPRRPAGAGAGGAAAGPEPAPLPALPSGRHVVFQSPRQPRTRRSRCARHGRGGAHAQRARGASARPCPPGRCPRPAEL